MKSFGIITVLIAIFLQVEGRQSIIGTKLKLTRYLDDELQQAFRCSKKLGAVKVTQLPPISRMEQLPENNSVLNEYFECIWKEKEIFSENAVLNEGKLEEYLIFLFPIFGVAGSGEQETAYDTVQKCKNVLGNDSGQTAVKIQNCITKIIKKIT